MVNNRVYKSESKIYDKVSLILSTSEPELYCSLNKSAPLSFIKVVYSSYLFELVSFSYLK